MKTVYLPMPVSAEVKREWNKKGYRVVDAEFMPEGFDNPSEDKAEGELSAKDAIALIAKMTDKEKLLEFSEDSRKTVKAAAESRLAELE